LNDDENPIRRRMPLAFYFPEILEHELRIYPTLDQLRKHWREAGFKMVCEEIVETPFVLADIDKYRNKAFSCLKLISKRAFGAGIEKMRRDLAKGPIQCVSRNLVLRNRK
jgi:hypothetical protein